MLVAVISDTHDNIFAIKSLINVLREHRPSLIIHLGDIISPFAFRELLTYPGKFIVILGNNDGDKLLLREIAMKAGATIREGPYEIVIDNKRVIALHGFGSTENTLNIIEALSLSGKYDIVLYGHTHRVDVRKVGKTLVVNPGECCGYLTGRKTFALLDTEKMDVRILDVP